MRNVIGLFLLFSWAGQETSGQPVKEDADVVIIITKEGRNSKYIEKTRFLKGERKQLPVEVKVGDKVMWKNLDGMNHSATSEKEGLFDVEIEKNNGTAVVLFTPEIYKKAGGKPGAFVEIRYYCTDHPESMKKDVAIKLVDAKKKQK